MTSPVRPHVVTRDSPAQVADAVAIALLEELRLRSNTPGRSPVHVVLTGGSVAALVHRSLRMLLAQAPDEVDWARVHFWWGDERWVSRDDAERNERQAREDLLDALELPAENLHPMPACPPNTSPHDAQTLEAAAASASHEVRNRAPETWDLVMLGTGPDGHVASLFPGQHHGIEPLPEVVAVPDSPKPPPARLSMSYPRLAATELCWVFATGAAKADAVNHAYLRGGLPLGAVTAGVQRGGGRVTWYLDAEAAPPGSG